MKEYVLIDRKILELEEMQNTLIQENDNLRSKLDAKSLPIKDFDKIDSYNVTPLFKLSFVRRKS